MLLAASIPAFGQTKNDSIQMPSGNFKGLEWRIGAEVSPAYVFPTNAYLKGSNEYGDKIKAAFSAGIRADFSFNECSKWGILYNGAYQGLGIDWSVSPLRAYWETLRQCLSIRVRLSSGSTKD